MKYDHVRWIGGGSGAGKSVIARRLAAAHGATIYDTDAMMADHVARCSPQECPHLAQFLAMDMDARWVARTPQAMLDTFHWFQGEGFDLILEDLASMPRDRLILVEGFRLLPRLVFPVLDDVRDAVWLLPTPAFRRHAFEARGSMMDIPNKTRNPARALENLMTRDALFTQRLRLETEQLGLTTHMIDGRISEADMAGYVGAQFFR